MKKILAVLALAFAVLGGAFAFDLGSIRGTWQDEKWDANWTFSADGKIVLTKASSGETVYTFSDSNVQNFKLDANASGVSVSFKCDETERAYRFTKAISAGSDLELTVDPDWTSEDYTTAIKFQR